MDLREHLRKKEEAEKGVAALLPQLQARVSGAIDVLQAEILKLDLAAGGGRAGLALDGLAELIDALTLHYVADQKVMLEGHAAHHVCIPRKVWEKAQSQDSMGALIGDEQEAGMVAEEESQHNTGEESDSDEG